MGGDPGAPKGGLFQHCCEVCFLFLLQILQKKGGVGGKGRTYHHKDSRCLGGGEEGAKST